MVNNNNEVMQTDGNNIVMFVDGDSKTSILPECYVVSLFSLYYGSDYG